MWIGHLETWFTGGLGSYGLIAEFGAHLHIQLNILLHQYE